MRLIRNIADHLEVDARQFAVALFGGLLIIGIVGVLTYINFSIWRLAHPEAPWWTWMFN